MAEYTNSSQAIREYMSARERTAYWVQVHNPEETQLLSPSIPPSEIESEWVPSPPSDAGSSHSLPPKMVLRYNDGRPDIPVPRDAHAISHSRSGRSYDEYGSRSHNHSHSDSYNRGRSNSHAAVPLSHSHSGRRDDHHRRHRERSPPRVPEEIRILPSDGTQTVPRSTAHYRSKSLPRATDPSLQPDVPFIPDAPASPPVPHRAPTHHAPQPMPHSAPPPQVTFAQQWDPRTGRMVNPMTQRNAPAVIYAAPSHRGGGTHYSPPQMYHYPPQRGPNGMMYSHSAPVYSSQYAQNGYAPGMEASSSYHGRSEHADNDRRSRSRHGSHKRRGRSRSNSTGAGLHRAHSSTSFESGETGSTYYVVPSGGQKVHVVKPSPEHSIVTATSTTKSASSPHSTGFKKPFFQRLFSFAKFSTAGSTNGSTHGGRKLHRRHSTGASRRRLEQAHAQQQMQHGRLPS